MKRSNIKPGVFVKDGFNSVVFVNKIVPNGDYARVYMCSRDDTFDRGRFWHLQMTNRRQLRHIRPADPTDIIIFMTEATEFVKNQVKKIDT